MRNTKNPDDPKYEQEDTHGGHIIARMDIAPDDDLKGLKIGLVTISILFCWLFIIEGQCKKVLSKNKVCI